MRAYAPRQRNSEYAMLITLVCLLILIGLCLIGYGAGLTIEGFHISTVLQEARRHLDNET